MIHKSAGIAYVVLSLICVAPVFAENPRHVLVEPGVEFETLKQNWSDKEANWFYNAKQGSRLLPYVWFLHLEQAGSNTPFRDEGHIRALGYIPRSADPDNKDGLPIGFIEDAPYDEAQAGTDKRGLGMTCAACHTGLIHHENKAYLVDGAPAMGDFSRFQRELADSLNATHTDSAKFDRFATAVLGVTANASDKTTLKNRLKQVADERSSYNTRNLPEAGAAPFGPGRVDAFGAIFNEVSSTFLKIDTNRKPANAPVSYPCLWDAPQHDRVQWNGAAENRTSPLGPRLFGTEKVGALGRNSGEVIGVFGHVDIAPKNIPLPIPIPNHYKSTVNHDNLIQIEETLTRLWSPRWPDEMGPRDPALLQRGEALFCHNCKDCHALIDREDEHRTVTAYLDEGTVKTDPQLNDNFARIGDTGILKGQHTTLSPHSERFQDKAPVALILKHVVERVILRPQLSVPEIKNALVEVSAMHNSLEAVDALNPGYQMTATIDLGGDDKLVGQFDSLTQTGDSLRITRGLFRLKSKHAAATALGEEVDLRSREFIKAAARRLKEHVLESESGDSATSEVKGTVKFGYKARPLNGIWATAPYLHNGSVPTLAELLKPAADRKAQFHVGSRVFDPINVGFVNDTTQPQFDTTLTGNKNIGHEYGTDLSDADRQALLEYLKSL